MPNVRPTFEPGLPCEPDVFDHDPGLAIAKWLLESYGTSYSLGNDQAQERILSHAGPQLSRLLALAIARHYAI